MHVYDYNLRTQVKHEQQILEPDGKPEYPVIDSLDCLIQETLPPLPQALVSLSAAYSNAHAFSLMRGSD